MAASASPVVTSASVESTSWPRVTLEAGMVTWALAKAWSAVNPQGAVFTQIATTPALSRPAREWIPSGFPDLTTISRELRAKIAGVPAMSTACCTGAMSWVEAEANTSAGAPCWICVASVPDEPKLNETVVPGCADWNIVPRVPKAPLSDDAADTVIVPLSAAVVAVVAVVLVAVDELPQAAAVARATRASAAAARRWSRVGLEKGLVMQ